MYVKSLLSILFEFTINLKQCEGNKMSSFEIQFIDESEGTLPNYLCVNINLMKLPAIEIDYQLLKSIIALDMTMLTIFLLKITKEIN